MFECNNAQKEAENSIVNVGRNILKTHTINGVPLSRANEHVSFIEQSIFDISADRNTNREIDFES